MTIEEILRLRQEAGGLNKLMHMHVVTLDQYGGATVELDLTEDLLVWRMAARYSLCATSPPDLPPRRMVALPLRLTAIFITTVRDIWEKN